MSDIHKIHSEHPFPWTTKQTNAGTGIFDATGADVCWEWDIDEELAKFIVDCVNRQASHYTLPLAKGISWPSDSWD